MFQLNPLKKNKDIGKKQAIGRAIGCISAMAVELNLQQRMLSGLIQMLIGMRTETTTMVVTLWFLAKNTGLKTVSIGL